MQRQTYFKKYVINILTDHPTLSSKVSISSPPSRQVVEISPSLRRYLAGKLQHKTGEKNHNLLSQYLDILGETRYFVTDSHRALIKICHPLT